MSGTSAEPAATSPAGPSAEIEIRPVTADDLDELTEIYLAGGRHHAAIDPDGFRVPDRAAARIRLARRVAARGPAHEYVAAIVDRVMAGSATMDIEDEPDPGSMARPVPSAELGIAVLEGYRGQGIGRRLISHLEEWAASRGAERINLQVTSSNDGAIALYHRLGYVDSGFEMRKSVRP
ncbi:MAG TPA: GNAT family N-acetyltransferase [Candidatus Limnocylindrales bacterium]|nr:GNAT family N-acetyltransferase [Candidatus Limnocylindrales bacterium]